MAHVKNELCLAMLGKTGEGKSSTGNTILQKDENDFVAKSVTMLVRYGKTKIGDETLYVFDTPGEGFESGFFEEDKGKSDKERKFSELKRTINHIELVLGYRERDGGVSAFVLVLRCDCKFTGEDETIFSTYRKILGPEIFSSNGIIALTHGDSFEQHEGYSDVNLWCEVQFGPFKDLYNECKRRVVLMYNTTKDRHKEQRQKGVDDLIRYARQIKSERHPYTWEKYELASESRKDIYLEYQSLTLTQGFNNDLEKINRQMAENIRVLKEKNNQLRQQTVCKICMDKEVAVVFLPCGHLVSCSECGAAMKDCPVCRVNIKGVVRVFMS